MSEPSVSCPTKLLQNVFYAYACAKRCKRVGMGGKTIRVMLLKAFSYVICSNARRKREGATRRCRAIQVTVCQLN